MVFFLFSYEDSIFFEFLLDKVSNYVVYFLIVYFVLIENKYFLLYFKFYFSSLFKTVILIKARTYQEYDIFINGLWTGLDVINRKLSMTRNVMFIKWTGYKHDMKH